MDAENKALRERVHCRIGSSETARGPHAAGHPVHCRIGSSEIINSGAS